MKRTMLAGAAAVVAVMVPVAPALAVGGPNEAGNSGKFHPNSGPCQGKSDHPHCAGPH